MHLQLPIAVMLPGTELYANITLGKRKVWCYMQFQDSALELSGFLLSGSIVLSTRGSGISDTCICFLHKRWSMFCT